MAQATVSAGPGLLREVIGVEVGAANARPARPGGKARRADLQAEFAAVIVSAPTQGAV
jgi:hypothetical protein